MNLIQKLPEHLINQIAAGEVVERPASVVKELVENSIDAAAKSIQIHTHEGGKAQILIIDDGKGMSREDLKLSIERHATSKLKEKNLLAIETMGFRGEALPSIASIARMKIRTSVIGSSEAWELSIEGGKIGDLRPAAPMQGTRVDIRDLFFATPARLKFLRSLRSENEAILEVVQRIAMAHPALSFEYFNEGKKICSYAAYEGGDACLQRLADVMGVSFSENALEIAAEEEEMQLYGYASLPTLHRSTARHQYFFVNGRPVKDKLLYSAVKAAYQDFLPGGRHPLLAIFLSVPCGDVDVNVHPAKTEVRFRAASTVRQFILRGLRQALQGMGHRASSENANAMIEKFQVEKFQRQSPMNRSFAKSYDRVNHALMGRVSNAATPQYSAYETQRPLDLEAVPSANFYPRNDPTQSVSDEAITYPLGVARAQIHKNYIIAQTSDGMIIIDQHAAHERLVYEQMKTAYVGSGVDRQGVLVPEVIEFSEGDYVLLMLHAESLLKLGLAIDSFGKNSIIVREIPALLAGASPKSLIEDVLDALHAMDEGQLLKDRLEELCASFGCHGAIRSGRILNQEEMNHLLREMEATNYSGQCNHGRPTYVHLKLDDIEKLFGRK